MSMLGVPGELCVALPPPAMAVALAPMALLLDGAAAMLLLLLLMGVGAGAAARDVALPAARRLAGTVLPLQTSGNVCATLALPQNAFQSAH